MYIELLTAQAAMQRKEADRLLLSGTVFEVSVCTVCKVYVCARDQCINE